MIPATSEEQRRLLGLQHLDTAIRQLEHRRADLPEQQALDFNADTLRKVVAEHTTAREESETLERRQRRLEGEVAQVDARRKAEEGRMYSGLITSEKELEALRAELGSLRSRKNELEDTELEVMERLEELTGLLATLDERRTELSGAVEELRVRRDDAAREIDTELAAQAAERDEVAAGIAGDIMELYDDLRARKSGVAVAALEGRTCAGCRLDLTAIELEETRERVEKGLARCPQCDRIIVLA